VQSYRHADPRQANLRLELGFDLWSFDLRVSACPGPAMDYMSTDFGADSSSRFILERDKQTVRRDWTPYPTPAAIQQEWIITITQCFVLSFKLYPTLIWFRLRFYFPYLTTSLMFLYAHKLLRHCLIVFLFFYKNI